jgi:hypothetical protein
MIDEPVPHTPHPFEAKLRDFYDTTLYQHKVSFWASVGASVAGLSALLIALVAYFRDPSNLNESVVLGVAGVVSQLVSALFFYLHNKSTSQVLAGFEKLVKLQDTRLAIELVGRMNEKNHDYMFMNISMFSCCVMSQTVSFRQIW